jgi:hypothetical protein
MLYPNLSELDRTTAFDAALRERNESELKDMFTGIGMSGLLHFVEFCEPELRDLFARRGTSEPDRIAAFSERHCDQAVKLFRRRTPSWSAIID